jgi:hypothetical protein
MKLKVFSYIPTLIILEDNVAYVIEAGGDQSDFMA